MRDRYVLVLVLLLIASLFLNQLTYRALGETRERLEARLSSLEHNLSIVKTDVTSLHSRVSELKEAADWVRDLHVNIEDSQATISWFLSSVQQGQRVYLLYRKRGEVEWQEASAVGSGPEFVARFPVEMERKLDVFFGVVREEGGAKRELAPEGPAGGIYEYVIVAESGEGKQVAGPYTFMAAPQRRLKVHLEERGGHCLVIVNGAEGLTLVFRATADGAVLDELTLEGEEGSLTYGWWIPAETETVLLTVKSGSEVLGEYSVPWQVSRQLDGDDR